MLLYLEILFWSRTTKMRAIQIHSLGGPSVLQIDYNLPIPKPKKNEVRFCCFF